ncbi:MAG: hypothetical protein OEO21_01900 [Candidatus Krumholzibacteria bacterium]|nr:hypothetical protein [Candidatus Krumholzibacteria bacterium]
MESFFSQLGPAVFVLPFVGFASLAVWAVRKEARRKREQREHMMRMGYTPLAAPPDTLVARIAALRGRAQEKIALREVSERSLYDGHIYIFDLIDKKGNEKTPVGMRVVAVVAPGLHLPRFHLFPRLDARHRGGWMAKAAEKLVRWAAAQAGLQPLELAISPAFDDRYWIFGTDGGEVREFLGNGRGTHLAGLEAPYAIQAHGDTFTIEAAPARAKRNPHSTLDLERRVEDAKRVLSWFA